MVQEWYKSGDKGGKTGACRSEGVKRVECVECVSACGVCRVTSEYGRVE